MMRIKKFTGPNIARSLQLAKEEMGEDALILGTMRRRKGARDIVEIVAANNKAATTARNLPEPAAAQNAAATAGADAAPETGAAATPARAAAPRPGGGIDLGVVHELEQMESRLNEILGKLLPSIPGRQRKNLTELKINLHNAGFDPGLVQRRFLKSEPGPKSSFETYLHDLIGDVPIETPDERVSVFVGPSGSGKTTALLKVASALKRRGIRPKVIYYGAAVNGENAGLRQHCKRLGMKLRVVSDGKKLIREIRNAGKSPVLIDTSGITSIGDDRLEFLAALTEELEGAAIRLVVNAAMDPVNISAIASCVPRTARLSLVLTKLDEATRIGGAISAAMKERIPVAYLTGGRDVDSGVFVPDRGLLYDRVLEGMANTGTEGN